MNRIAEFLARRRWVLFVVPLFVAIAFVVPASDDNSSQTYWIIGTLIAVVIAVLVLLVNLAGHDPEADELATAAVADPVGQALIGRWLRRSRYYRFVGGLTGFVIGFGFIGSGAFAPLLIGALGGIAVGGALAEIHILRRRSPASRVADLTTRAVAEYVHRRDVAALAVVGFAAAAIAVAAAAIPTVPTGPPVLWAASALLTVTAAGALMRSVVMRPRPALTSELRHADDLLRRLAATRGFVRPAIAFAVGLVAEAVDALGTTSGYTDVSVILWVVGLAWYALGRLNTVPTPDQQMITA